MPGALAAGLTLRLREVTSNRYCVVLIVLYELSKPLFMGDHFSRKRLSKDCGAIHPLAGQRATIKAHSSPFHHPRPYGKVFSTEGWRALRVVLSASQGASYAVMIRPSCMLRTRSAASTITTS